MFNKMISILFVVALSASRAYAGTEGVLCKVAKHIEASYCYPLTNELTISQFDNPWVVTNNKLILPNGEEFFHDLADDDDLEAELKKLIENPKEFGVETEDLMMAYYSEHDGGER